jgi:hypothetical protein
MPEQAPPTNGGGGGWTMAFLVFLFVMACLLFVDCRLVYVGPRNGHVQWYDDEDAEDSCESWDVDAPLIRTVSAIRKKERQTTST